MCRETGDLQIVRDYYPYLVKYVDSLIVQAETLGLKGMIQR